MQVDLNCDMGEGFGRYQIGQDESLIQLVTSANIACGFHAGDPVVMHNTLRLAVENGTAVGAHPGYDDLQGFGRRVLDLTMDEITMMVTYQIGALAAIANLNKAELVHVKPHGALYNKAAADMDVARAIAKAVAGFSKELILVGLAGYALIEAGQDAGLRVANEGFPERGYNPDGSLRSRKLPGALIHDPKEAAQQALRLVTEGIRVNGNQHSVDTLCIHGDSPQALAITKAIRALLAKNDVVVRAL